MLEQKHVATVLACISAIGVLVTGILVAKETPKVTDLLKEAEATKEATLTIAEKAVIAVPAYLPSILIGSSTIACIFGTNVLNHKQQASILSAYALTSNSFKEYRKKLIELHGEETDNEVREHIIGEFCDYHLINNDRPDTKALFYDPYSKRTICRYEKEIIDAEYHFNRNFVLHGMSTLNDFYSFLGLDPVDWGDDIGWSMEGGYCWVDIEHRLKSHGKNCAPVYEFSFVFDPNKEAIEDYM